MVEFSDVEKMKIKVLTKIGKDIPNTEFSAVKDMLASTLMEAIKKNNLIIYSEEARDDYIIFSAGIDIKNGKKGTKKIGILYD